MLISDGSDDLQEKAEKLSLSGIFLRNYLHQIEKESCFSHYLLVYCKTPLLYTVYHNAAINWKQTSTDFGNPLCNSFT